MSNLSGQQVADEALAGWVNLVGGLQTRILTGTFATGLTVLNAIGAAAEEMDHHPDLDLRWRTLHLALVSHSVGGVSELDLDLARRIDALLPG